MADRTTPAGAGLEPPEPAKTLFGAPRSDPEPDPQEPQEEELTPEELLAKNRELEARLEERTRTLDALIENPPGRAEPPPVAPRRPAPPDPGPMPDPTTESEDFRKWMASDRAYRDHQTEQRIMGVRQDSDRNSLLNSLWDQFQHDYPDQAKDREFVTIAFQAVTGGRIPSDTAGQDKMLKGIADRIKAQGGKGEEPDPKPADRTGGLSRGTRPRRTRREPNPDPPKSLKDSIGDRQVNSPFF